MVNVLERGVFQRNQCLRVAAPFRHLIDVIIHKLCHFCRSTKSSSEFNGASCTNTSSVIRNDILDLYERELVTFGGGRD